MSARKATRKEIGLFLKFKKGEMKELTESDFKRAISGKLRRKLAAGKINSGADVTALRKFVGLSQVEFAKALGISVSTLRNWKQGRRMPEGPALALLRIAARHPRMISANHTLLA